MEVAGMTGWKPALQNGSTAALKTVLEQVDKDMVDKYLNETSFAGLPSGAMAGVSGELLYLFYSAAYNNNDATYDLAFEKLEQLISDIDINTSLTFCSGLCGLLWTLYHLDNIDLVPDAGSMIDEETIDMLYQKWMPALANGDYDFMHGGMSLALPLIACRKKTDKHRHYLEAMVDALDKSAIKKDDMAWWMYIIDARKSNETGISFGMSHGLPGIIALLSKIHMQGIAQEKCVTLIGQLVNTLLNNRNTSEFKNYLFAANLRQDGKKEPFAGAGRMAWCYGDANIAIAMLYAYKATGTAEYMEEAHTILNHISYYTDYNSQFVFDADFCHGAFGNAHILSRLYNVTGMAELADSAGFWYARGLEKTKFEDGVLKFLHVEDQIATWSVTTNVISGKAGIGLAIMSALSDTAPDWDDMFLLNI